MSLARAVKVQQTARVITFKTKQKNDSKLLARADVKIYLDPLPQASLSYKCLHLGFS